MGCGPSAPEGAHDAGVGDKENAPPDLRFKAVLADEAATQEFLKFTQAEFSSENLEFYLAARGFAERWRSTEGHTAHTEAELCAMRREADAIIDQYLREGADTQICVGASVHRVFEEASAANCSSMFEAPLRVALRELQNDSFPRFKESHAGAKLARSRPGLGAPAPSAKLADDLCPPGQ
mmetsp:Transcript_21957/g.44847  ORF Transcript_21957/g.44847 Transcript_21957/m.44847 type:complete len:180 (+) Transcript_21957:113-652(+)